jgi:4-hydroxybenzoate polyprenyltransferase
MKSIFQYINALSIDVSVGAVCSALFFAEYFRVKILPVGIASLGLTVWIIYSADHLLDAKRIQHPASTFRHRLYQDNFSTLLVVTTVACLIDSVLIFFIRRPVFVGGIILIGMVILYLTLNRWWKIPKEIIIALLYVCGVLLPSVAVTPMQIEYWPITLITQFFFTALLNLFIFAWYDRHHDTADQLSSFVLKFGEPKSKFIISALFGMNLLLTIFSGFERGSILVLAMNVILLVLYLKSDFFIKDERFRFIGDVVFILPILMFL